MTSEQITFIQKRQTISQIIWAVVVVYQLIAGIVTCCGGFWHIIPGLFLFCMGLWNTGRLIYHIILYPKLNADPQKLCHYWSVKLVRLIIALFLNFFIGGIFGAAAVIHDITLCVYVRENSTAGSDESTAGQ